jgi:hypothetical protein
VGFRSPYIDLEVSCELGVEQRLGLLKTGVRTKPQMTTIVICQHQYLPKRKKTFNILQGVFQNASHPLNSNRENFRMEIYFGLEVLKAVFRGVAPCSSEKVWRIGGKQRLNLQGKMQKVKLSLYLTN